MRWIQPWKWALPLVALLATGCLQFSEEAYCAEHPDACTLRVTELKPDRGPVAGGTRVRVTGTAFEPGLQVEVDGIPAETLVTSSATLDFTTPPHAHGPLDITFRNKSETVTVPQAFFYGPRPQISLFYPAAGSTLGGTLVTIAGENIGQTLQVKIGGLPAQRRPVALGATVFQAFAPAASPGTYDVELTNEFNETVVLSGAFRYEAPWVERSEGLVGGNILALWVDPQEPSRILAGTTGGGLFQSQDSGNTWARFGTQFLNQDVRGLLYDASAAVLYASTSVGIFRSADRGQSWTAVNQGFPISSYSTLTLGPDGALYALSFSGLYVLAAGKAAWEHLFPRLQYTNNTPTAIAVTAAGTYAGTFGLAHFQAAGDSAWVAQPMPGVAFQTMTPLPDGSGAVYAGTSSGLYRLNRGTVPVRLLEGADVRLVVPDPTRPGRLYVGTTTGLQVSTDSGGTWAPVEGLPALRSQAVVLGANNRVLVGTAGAGVFQGALDAPLSQSNTGLGAAEVLSLLVEASQPDHLYAGTSGGLFQSSNGGAHWSATPLAEVPPGVVAVQASTAQPRLVFASTAGGLRRSLNGGTTWEAVGPQEPIRSLAVVPSLPAQVYAVTEAGGLWHSPNAGGLWSDARGELTRFRMVAAGPGPAFPVYASLDSSSALYIRTGETWKALASELSLKALEVAPDGKTLVGYSAAVFLSTDGGQHWSGATPTGGPPTAVALPGNPDGSVLVGTTAGLYRRLFDPSTAGWFNLTQGLTGTSILSIALQPDAPGTVYAGTRGLGVQKSTIQGG